MRRLLVVLAAASLVPTALAAQRQLTAIATVESADGSDLDTVNADDFLFFEDQAEGRILQVEPVDRPLKLQVLVDNGIGMMNSLVDLRNAVRALIDAVPAGVEVTLVTTAPQPRFLVRATTSHDALLAGVDRLAPDTGAGMFPESLMEAAERISKDTPHTAVIITVGTNVGYTDVREGDLRRMFERLDASHATVHAAIYSGRQTATAGLFQAELAQSLAQRTGGRYEILANTNRLPGLLVEMVEAVKASTGAGSATETRQFRVTIERPGGRSGDLGSLQIATGDRFALVSSRLE